MMKCKHNKLFIKMNNYSPDGWKKGTSFTGKIAICKDGRTKKSDEIIEFENDGWIRKRKTKN